MSNTVELLTIKTYVPDDRGENLGAMLTHTVKPVDKWKCPHCLTLIVNETKCGCCGYEKR